MGMKGGGDRDGGRKERDGGILRRRERKSLTQLFYFSDLLQKVTVFNYATLLTR